MNPPEASGQSELFAAQRGADENVGVRKFVREPLVVGEFDQGEPRPTFANRLRQHGLGPPFAKRVPHADQQFTVLGAGPDGFARPGHYGRMRRSLPVISAGRSWPSTPRRVGAMSRSAPPGRSFSFSFSLTRMNGTGLVV